MKHKTAQIRRRTLLMNNKTNVVKYSANNVKPFKARSPITLVLLPPKEEKEVAQEDIAQFYKKLTNILISKDLK